jgi:hypothetical protein
MAELHYGVVQQDGRWIIIGQNLRYGSYKHRSSAVRAARRLARQSIGRAVTLHIQDDAGPILRTQNLPEEA